MKLCGDPPPPAYTTHIPRCYELKSFCNLTASHTRLVAFEPIYLKRKHHENSAELKDVVDQHTDHAHPEWITRRKLRIHMRSATNAYSGLRPSTVLGDAVSPINIEEKQLPRQGRTNLAQLWCEFSISLSSYLSRIREHVEDRCLFCNAPVHVTIHLFHCLKSPTDLDAES